MKRSYSLILIILMGFSTTLVSADFFNEQILGSDPETAMVEDIALNNITLKDSKEITRYNNTTYFIAGIKAEAVKRFNDGTISYYRQHDIITSLDSFVYTMNQYFSYEKRYEQTGNDAYKERARSYLEDSRGDYARLRAALKKSTY
ncbi:MAG: hypothetical protein PHH16_01565 [Candidatus Gracilibacteria bacterium]|nr:hypothetical protein [Candidatus Gracilibacteria bacterium]